MPMNDKTCDQRKSAPQGVGEGLLHAPTKEKHQIRQKRSPLWCFLWYNIIVKNIKPRKDCTPKMSICQLRLNMNFYRTAKYFAAAKKLLKNCEKNRFSD